MQEIWKPVIGYEGRYEISNLGNARRIARETFEKNGKCRNLKLRPSKLSIHHTGYVYFHPYNGVKVTNLFVHRAVAMAFPEICGQWFEGATVDHLNGIKTDNRAENLRVCTMSENQRNPVTWDKKIEHALKNLEMINSSKR